MSLKRIFAHNLIEINKRKQLIFNSHINCIPISETSSLNEAIVTNLITMGIELSLTTLYRKFATHHISCLYTCVVHEVFLDKSCFRLEVRNTVENKISWVLRKQIQMYWNKMKIKWPKHDQDQKQRGWFFKQVNIFRFEMATIFNHYDRELTFSRLKPASSFGEKF